MPRRSRIDAPGALHHIIARGIARENIFQDDRDRDDLLERLGTILEETRASCYAWALMPNHCHILLRTGPTPMSTVMRRLLTGYAVSHNRRHCRQGHLFQNRYKSILCQEDPYLLELIRYIHLTPLRAKVVDDLESLDKYPYCGHSALLGKCKNGWQDTDYILSLFAETVSLARRRYREFFQKGITQGKRPDLVGGGLIRSVGGWSAAKTLRKAGAYQKGDERILGNGDFVENALEQAEENLECRYHLKANGFDFERVVTRVANLAGLSSSEVLASGRYRKTVEARSIVCFWAMRELGISQSHLAQKFGISQPAVSMAVTRGAELAKLHNFSLIED
ncbi:MAG: transposase [Deltaproteobacteria bacterium]|nr:MAG: transposase [Deltaproteobacteria bacterium]